MRGPSIARIARTRRSDRIGMRELTGGHRGSGSGPNWITPAMAGDPDSEIERLATAWTADQVEEQVRACGEALAPKLEAHPLKRLLRPKQSLQTASETSRPPDPWHLE